MLHADRQTPYRADYLLRRFPGQQACVMELIRIDQQVAEINDEYTEVCTILEDMEAEGQGTTFTANELRRLQTELEEEISVVLKTADHAR